MLAPPNPSRPAVPKTDGETVEALLAQLRDAARAAGMTRDEPMMPLLTAFASAIRFLDERTGRSERIAQQSTQQITDALLQARAAADAEATRFQTGLARTEADTVQRIGTSIARSADAALNRRIRVFDRNTALAAAGLLFAATAACLGGGYWWGHHDALADVHETEVGLRAAFDQDPAAARDWLNLMQWNGIHGALEQCTGSIVTLQGGRRACTVPLWIEPLPSTPEVER